MRLETLMGSLSVIRVIGNQEIIIKSLEYDSRKVTEGALFVCLKGFASNGHDFAARAVEMGACALLVEDLPDFETEATIIQVKDTRRALALLAAAWYGYPGARMTVIGITGTKGKTTTAHMIKGILEEDGKKVGMIGTMGAYIGTEHIPTRNTTPESLELHSLFDRMNREGCTHVVMEVSSQALKLDRTYGITFDVGIYLNISPDHIGAGEHTDFQDYLSCKGLLFDQVKQAVVNADDKEWRAVAGKAPKIYLFSQRANSGDTFTTEALPGKAISQEALPGKATSQEALSGKAISRQSFSQQAEVFIMADQVEKLWNPGLLGSAFPVHGAYEGRIELSVPGEFNVENALAALGTVKLLGVELATAVRALGRVSVKGRTQLLGCASHFTTLLIDYAHNALSMESLLVMLKGYEPKRLICLFGGGGNKPRARRYDMGLMAGKYADLTILTTDNPRWESVDDINQEIIEGLNVHHGRYMIMNDREKAIHYLIDHCEKGDIAVLIGKGHEEYQEIAGTRYYFSEQKIVESYLESK